MSPASSTGRAGLWVQQPGGHRAFVPKALPPHPPLDASRLQRLLSRADQALGRLDGVTETVPDPDYFVAMYVRREAVLSSQIEGTQSTLEDLLALEASSDAAVRDDVDEIVNYVAAMNYGLGRLSSLPVSLRLIRELHARLLAGTRGDQRAAGEFRRTPNWIGPAGAGIEEATFVPPPVPDMQAALADLELFLHEGEQLPDLLMAALAHAQFETIHPFLDGNGRVGRLLITLLLVERGAVRRPLLYLSVFLKEHRSEYYARLTAVREEGDWEGWAEFFLRGVIETATEAQQVARQIFALREEHRAMIVGDRLGTNALALLSVMFAHPYLTVSLAERELSVSFGTANRLIAKMQALGLLVEVTGQRRSRLFRYEPYLSLFR
jgi:Fic family protein